MAITTVEGGRSRRSSARVAKPPSLVPQLDGGLYRKSQVAEKEEAIITCPLCKDDHGYCCCGVCDECEYTSTEEGLNVHIMNQHEPTDVVTCLGQQWAKDKMSFVLRNPDIANDRRQSAKWDKLYL
jgi:hypothetical protein